MPSVLCISAMKQLADRYKAALERAGYAVQTACGISEALICCGEKRFDAVVLGPYVSNKAAVAEEIRTRHPFARVVAVLREREGEIPGMRCVPPGLDATTIVSAIDGTLKN
jgi:DNA-binding NtrC family response regulator